MDPKLSYAVAVFGFTQTEKVVLRSIFSLSARRVPVFKPVDPAQPETPDLFLVDTDSAAAIEEFRSSAASGEQPVVLIGTDARGLPWPLLGRPLQWGRLLKAFDLAVESALGGPLRGNTTTQQLAILAQDPAPVNLNRTLPSAKAAIFHLTSHGMPAVAPGQATLRMPAVAPEQATLLMPAVAPGTVPTAPAVLRQPQPAGMPPPALPRTGSVLVRSTPPSLAPSARAPVPPPAAQLDWALVVDDNATVREFMRAKLAPFQINVDFAESGEEAIGLTGKRQYSCVFLDVVMPGMDGYQVCKLIKQRKNVKKTAVVMLTSKGSPFDRIRGTMAGCDSYLTKPVDEDKLLETISKYLDI